jgi:hypothetical protein
MRFLIRITTLALAAVGIKALYERYAKRQAVAGSSGGTTVLDSAKDAAVGVVEHAKSAAVEVAGHAKSAASEVAADARARADDVKHAAHDTASETTSGSGGASARA